MNNERTGRRFRARHLLGLFVVLAIAGAGAVVLSNRNKTASSNATVKVEAFADLGGDAVIISNGRTTLADLAATLSAQGTSDAVTDNGGTFRVTKSIVIAAGGRLDATSATIELASGDKPVAIEARGGEIRLVKSTLRAVDPVSGQTDNDPTNGRSWVAARDGGRIVISATTFDSVGDLAKHPAIEVAGGTTAAVLRDTIITGGSGVAVRGGGNTQMMSVTIESPKMAGITLDAARNARLEKVTVRAGAADGITLAGGSKDIKITDANVQSNVGDGLSIAAASSGITVTNGLFQMNQGAGIGIDSAYGVHFTGTDSIGNAVGIDLSASSNDVTIDKGRLASNRLAGLRLGSPGAVASVTNTRIDHNDSGILVEDGNAVIGPNNKISSNGTGIKLLDTSPGLTVTNNRVFDNFGDGMFLVSNKGVDVRKNKFENNQFASFGVLTTGESAEWRKTNDIKPGIRFGWERIPQNFETRILTGAGPDVPARAIPEVVTYYAPLPKLPTGAAGATVPNPLTTPNNLPPEAIAEIIRRAEKAAADAAKALTRQ